ncbi:MAG: hypothetical protein AB7E80_03095 [Hyphomicrobiaceae bacterium]
MIEEQPNLMQRFRFWMGASGRRYVHSVYALRDCPELSAANYILVRREADGKRTILSIGRLVSEAPTLNLADIRQRGASLGADEVHVHLLAESARDSQLIEFDLISGHFDVDAAERGTLSH